MNSSKIGSWVVGVLVVIAVLITARQYLEIASVTKAVSYESVPFNRPLPAADLKFLFLGDSTAVGTGALSNQLSTAGYFGQDFPLAEVINYGVNGKRIRELLTDLETKKFGNFNLVVIQIGGNDIMKFTPYSNIEDDLLKVIQKAKTFGRHVVILHSGNVGTAPIFHWPFDYIMTQRTRKVREIYMRSAKTLGVIYVDLFAEKKDDVFLTDVTRYYSSDFLHPSGDGYRWWYDRIVETLKQHGVILYQKPYEKPTI
ncbi:MAG: SGNH/GDSL hydrolase family protein [Candidatus Omnitrophica bacterium]|nr:SGNH/GDSL hydrolase family protein [Candidatus Omnitrophota bacterium]